MSSKLLLKNIMLSLEAEKLAHSEQAYAEYLRNSARDYSESADHGQTSQEFEDAEVALAFEGPLHTEAQALDKLHKIDFGVKSEVKEGAVVRFNSQWFVIAIATSQFVCDGVTFMGISKEAPIFKAMKSKRAGEIFDFNGRKIKIEAVG
ncbi:MAG TPA: hypothetical protein VGN12_07875 [Pirellulales bacterium]